MSARRRRRRHARELARRMAELDRLDRELGLGAMPGAPTARAPRTRARQSPVFAGLLVTALILACVVALSPAQGMQSIRRLIGFDDERLGAAPQVPQGVGSFKFLKTQPGGRAPVAYDPCRPIEVAINPDGAPDDYQQLVSTAMRHTSEATGLRFDSAGLTDDRTFDYGGAGLARRHPVLVAWATADEVSDLEGNVAGIGGSLAVDAGTGRMRFVTGRVILDRDAFATFDDDETRFAQAIVDHEFGHLVGLAHVDDPGELMYGDNIGRTTYGPGDREGLARLGSVDCF
jgi:hypothetical protein